MDVNTRSGQHPDGGQGSIIGVPSDAVCTEESSMVQTDYTRIRFDVAHNGVATITFDLPRMANAMDLVGIQEDARRVAAGDEGAADVGAVVLTGRATRRSPRASTSGRSPRGTGTRSIERPFRVAGDVVAPGAAPDYPYSATGAGRRQRGGRGVGLGMTLVRRPGRLHGQRHASCARGTPSDWPTTPRPATRWSRSSASAARWNGCDQPARSTRSEALEMATW